MKVVLTMLVRNEADVVEAQIAHHLNAGVDFVVAIDNESTDGTSDVLEAYAREGHLVRLPRSGGVQESPWRTHMAQLAAVEYGADWVFNADGDEFFWPRGESLKAVLAAVPARFGVLHAPSHVFVPVFDGPAFFAERMTLRFTPDAALNDPVSIYRPYTKLVHRADPGVVIDRGNHSLLAGDLRPMHGWHPIEVLHFPLRSAEQLAEKQRKWNRYPDVRAGGWYELAERLQASGRLSDHVDDVKLDEKTIARGLTAGYLTRDTRLRDALRELQVPAGMGERARSSRGHVPLPRATPGVEQAVDISMRISADLVRLSRDLDVIEARITRLAGRSR